MDTMPHKLDGRSLYHLIKIADHIVDRATGPAYDRIDMDDPIPVALAIMVTAKEIQSLKAAVHNARYVLEHVTFEVQPPHSVQRAMHSSDMAVEPKRHRDE